MNIRENKGITTITLIITIIILIILAAVSINGAISNVDETKDNTAMSELGIIQHAIFERYTKSQLTKEQLPGTSVNIEDVQSIIDEINTITSKNIELKGKTEDYKELTEQDLVALGITDGKDTFIVNYKTGEVINKTKKVTKSGEALYMYSKSDK